MSIWIKRACLALSSGFLDSCIFITSVSCAKSSALFAIAGGGEEFLVGVGMEECPKVGGGVDKVVGNGAVLDQLLDVAGLVLGVGQFVAVLAQMVSIDVSHHCY